MRRRCLCNFFETVEQYSVWSPVGSPGVKPVSERKFKIRINMILEKIIREKHGTIVDVRTAAEFSGGNVSGSVNIPLHEIPNRLDELKKLNHPLILCCASGGRSGQAHAYLAR